MVRPADVARHIAPAPASCSSSDRLLAGRQVRRVISMPWPCDSRV